MPRIIRECRHNLSIIGAAKYCPRYILAVALLAALALPGVFPKTNNPQSKNRKTTPARLEAKQIAQRVIPSVVLVTVECRDGLMVSSGSGFFVSDRLVATNRHVVECGDRGNIKFVGQNTTHQIVARWFHPDDSLDLALLKVEGAGKPSLSLSDGRNVSIASKVYAAGNPKGLEGTFSDGIVSSIRQSEKLIQHTAPISPGSSGGPLLDEYGKVIGINTLIVREGQNLNFAIPAQYLKTFLELVSGGKILAEKLIDNPGDRDATAGGSSSKTIEQMSPKSTGPNPSSPSKRALSGQELAVARKATDSLRRLRDGWFNADPELVLDGGAIIPEWKLDKRNYELFMLEAQDAVNSALKTVSDNVVREGLRSAMEIYLDLEEIHKTFARYSIIGDFAKVSDVYPYVKKYSLPYKTNQIHIGIVCAVLLPIGRERINHLISMLGGRPEPSPVNASHVELKFWRQVRRSGKPEDYESYLAKYPEGEFADEARTKTNEGEKIRQELAAIADRIIVAARKGDEATLDLLLDDECVERGGGKLRTKAQTLAVTSVDVMVKSYRIGAKDLEFRKGEPVLSCSVLYEGIDRSVSNYMNVFRFIRKQNQWKVIRWEWWKI